MILINRTRLMDWSKNLKNISKNEYLGIRWECVKKEWVGFTASGSKIYEYRFRFYGSKEHPDRYIEKSWVTTEQNQRGIAMVIISWNWGERRKERY